MVTVLRTQLILTAAHNKVQLISVIEEHLVETVRTTQLRDDKAKIKKSLINTACDEVPKESGISCGVIIQCTDMKIIHEKKPRLDNGPASDHGCRNKHMYQCCL